MTTDNKTHITIVCDRSGSMGSVASDAAGAINHFIVEQKQQPGECSLYFVDFDSDEPQRVVYSGALAEAPVYLLGARGTTPLLDAVGQAIGHTGSMLEAIAEDRRPGKVIFVIQTDGLENASREYTWEKVRDMIKEQTDKYSWQFIFLGMGLNTFKQGEALGIRNVVNAVANNAVSHAHTYDAMSSYTSAYRSGHAHDMTAMRGMTVNSVGQVYNEAGEEIDPKTGDVITPARA